MTTNSQAASIADDNEFHDALMKWLIDGDYHIEDGALICKGWDGLIACLDSKLAQARAEALREAAKICDDIGQDYRDQYKGRGQYEPNNPHRADPYADGAADGAWNCEGAITALLQPQGQAEISDWREKASAEFDSKEPLKNTESQ